MSSNKITINMFRSCLESKGFEVGFYYDRAKLYIDSANKISKIDRLCETIPKQDVIPRSLFHYDTMNFMVDAHQPDNIYLGRLANVLTGDYVINYVEFAMDIFCNNRNEVSKLREFINNLLIFERKRSDCRFYFYDYKNTSYYGTRHKHKYILTVYSDNASKLNAKKNCVHIELRLYGSKIIKEVGIYTVQDLIDFQHENIWDERLDLRDVNYNKLGRLSAKAKEGLADSSYWRLGQKTFCKYGSAQKLLMMEPHCAGAFVPIKNRRMFESRLNSALK